MSQKENFNQIYKDFAPGIRRLCLSYTGDEHLADDLLQETFITVWNSLDKFRNEAKISTWIYRITVNTCLLQLNRNKKTVQKSEDFFHKIEDEETPDKENQITILHKSISELKEADRIIITLVLDEKPYEEIAEITGITENNLRVKIHRIKKELTEIYQKNARI